MRVGNTYTQHFALETKQHEILGIDLGEGAPRRPLVMGLVLNGVWWAVMLLVFGAPSKPSFTAYFLPPLIVTVYGAQRASIDRRWKITQWAIGIRYLVLGHRPIVSGGRRAATRSEWMNRRARWGTRLEFLVDSPLGGPIERWLGDEESIPQGAGAPIRLAARPRLFGPDAVVKAYGRKAMEQRGKL
ncbi:hypothetical protein [Streptomyces sp. MBT53]|uniref:hypothetical protein n=1 Tax=Streptomyces sp. MBT53 TaxID=1488384 RepID=UPI001913E608|nr:hypothetical protein [Streptomyces sp. MBT53]MBK6015797.1 hypothetical protein [Streptomyces sp. MBT53]